MLRLNALVKQFGTHRALNGISATVATGDFVVIVGSNGAGKSTLFDCISGKTAVTSGSLLLNERDVTLIDEKDRSVFIARIFQNSMLNCAPDLTLRDHLALALLKGQRAELKQAHRGITPELIKHLEHTLQMKIEPLLDKPMGALSGGQRQLLAFGIATINRPLLLLLDEPTSALDPQAATQLLRTVLSYSAQERVTTLLITHDPDIALSIGNRIWVLESGRITKQLSAQDKSNLSAHDLIGSIDYQSLAGESTPLIDAQNDLE